MLTKQDKLEKLIDRFEKAGITDLDAEVHEMKSQEATDINNAGLADQIEYLLEKGGEDFIEALLDDPWKPSTAV